MRFAAFKSNDSIRPRRWSLACALAVCCAIADPWHALGQILVPRNQSGSEIQLGYWNLRAAEDWSRTRQDIQSMARAIQGFDCVVLGQLRDSKLLTKLVNELMILGGDWDKAQIPRRNG